MAIWKISKNLKNIIGVSVVTCVCKLFLRSPVGLLNICIVFFNKQNFSWKKNKLKLFERTWKKLVLPNERNFQNVEKKQLFCLQNERFFQKKIFEMNNRFYCPKNFTEQSFSEKTDEIDVKWTTIFRTDEMGRSRTMNERNEKKSNVFNLPWAVSRQSWYVTVKTANESLDLNRDVG